MLLRHLRHPRPKSVHRFQYRVLWNKKQATDYPPLINLQVPKETYYHLHLDQLLTFVLSPSNRGENFLKCFLIHWYLEKGQVVGDGLNETVPLFQEILLPTPSFWEPPTFTKNFCSLHSFLFAFNQ